MTELDYLDQASSEPFQKEVQHLIDTYKQRKAQRKERLNLMNSIDKQGDKGFSIDISDPNSSVAIDVNE